MPRPVEARRPVCAVGHPLAQELPKEARVVAAHAKRDLRRIEPPVDPVDVVLALGP